MKKIFISTLLMVTVSLSFTESAYAYLDPVTGSIILQGIVGTVAAASATVGLYWRQFKTFFRSIFSDPDHIEVEAEAVKQKGGAE